MSILYSSHFIIHTCINLKKDSCREPITSLTSQSLVDRNGPAETRAPLIFHSSSGDMILHYAASHRWNISQDQSTTTQYHDVSPAVCQWSAMWCFVMCLITFTLARDLTTQTLQKHVGWFLIKSRHCSLIPSLPCRRWLLSAVTFSQMGFSSWQPKRHFNGTRRKAPAVGERTENTAVARSGKTSDWKRIATMCSYVQLLDNKSVLNM